MKTVGMDAFKRGWVSACLDDPEFIRSHGSLREAHEFFGTGVRYYLDTPIGLTDGPTRQADLEARRCAGGSTVFPAPGLCSVEAVANGDVTLKQMPETQRDLYGVGMTQQALGIVPRIIEARAFRAALGEEVVREYHPEVAFGCCSGSVLRGVYSKHGLLGQVARLRILASHLTAERLRAVLSSPWLLDAVDAAIGAVMGNLIEQEPDRVCRLGANEAEGLIWAWGSARGLTDLSTARPEDVDALARFVQDASTGGL